MNRIEALTGAQERSIKLWRSIPERRLKGLEQILQKIGTLFFLCVKIYFLKFCDCEVD